MDIFYDNLEKKITLDKENLLITNSNEVLMIKQIFLFRKRKR